MRLALVLLAVLLALGPPGFAQGVPVQGPIPANTVQAAPVPPPCAPPNFLGWSGTWTCSPAPAGGAATTITSGPGVSVTGSAATGYTIAVNFPIHTKLASYTLLTTDGLATLPYRSAAAGTYTFPQAGSAGFVSPWTICFSADTATVGGGGALSLVQVAGATSKFHGGPTTLGPGQGECATVDDTNNWYLWSGVASAVANPNPVQ